LLDIQEAKLKEEAAAGQRELVKLKDQHAALLLIMDQ